MDPRKEQRVCIKLCANLGKSATETLTMIQQAFGDQSLSRERVFQWHARFKTGRTSVDDDKQRGRATSCTTPETVKQIQELVRQDRRRTIHNIVDEVGIGYGTRQRCVTEELAPNFGENRPGCFTMTTPPLTLLSSPSSFWRKTK
jgi:transposase